MQVYNRELKSLLKKFFEHYSINQEIIEYHKYKFETPILLKDFKYNLLSSHSNRRRFISYWHQQNFDDSTILDMIGSKDSEVLQGYKKKDVIATTKAVTNKLAQIKMLVKS